MASDLYAVPLSKRPPPGLLDYGQMLAFNAFFMAAMLGLHILQLSSLIFRIHPSTLGLYSSLRAWVKDVSRHLPV